MQDDSRKSLRFNLDRPDDKAANDFLACFERQKGRCVGVILGWILSSLKKQGIEFPAKRLKVFEYDGDSYIEYGNGTYLYFNDEDFSIQLVDFEKPVRLEKRTLYSFNVGSPTATPDISLLDSPTRILTNDVNEPKESSCVKVEAKSDSQSNASVDSNPILETSIFSSYEKSSCGDSIEESMDETTDFIKRAGSWMMDDD